MIEPYTAGEIIQLAVNNQLLDPMRVLAMYGDERNWEFYYLPIPTRESGGHWKWIGPNIPPFELAKRVCR